jgi:hypothetical protein
MYVYMNTYIYIYMYIQIYIGKMSIDYRYKFKKIVYTSLYDDKELEVELKRALEKRCVYVYEFIDMLIYTYICS